MPRRERRALLGVQPRARELADRLEQQEAALADRLHQARVDEPLEQVEVGARRRRSAASSENVPAKIASRANSACASGVEQVVAPGDRRLERALALGQVARALREQRQARVEAVEQRGRVEQPQPRGRQLERERQPVEPRGRSASIVSLGSSSRLVAARALEEQLDGRRPAAAARAGTRPRPRRAAASRLVTSRLQLGRLAEQLRDGRRRLDQVLEVVEQRRARARFAGGLRLRRAEELQHRGHDLRPGRRTRRG